MLKKCKMNKKHTIHRGREEGFSCVHLALSKCIPGVRFDDAALTEGLAAYVRRVFAREELDVAVLGCYLNLAHPEKDTIREFQSRYFGNLRVAALAGIGMVGTETGAPNAAYKLDANTHGDEALHTFMKNLEPVAERAEACGVTLAIEPVWNHIVYGPDRALEVLRGIGSPNLRIIFDPVKPGLPALRKGQYDTAAVLRGRFPVYIPFPDQFLHTPADAAFIQADNLRKLLHTDSGLPADLHNQETLGFIDPALAAVRLVQHCQVEFQFPCVFPEKLYTIHTPVLLMRTGYSLWLRLSTVYFCNKKPTRHTEVLLFRC